MARVALCCEGLAWHRQAILVEAPFTMAGKTSEQVRAILREQVRMSKEVDELSDRDDLFKAGMTSHGSVNLMLALEAALDIEFPDDMLNRSTFESIDSICNAIGKLRQERP
jgi:acyl carrier protein